MQHGGIMHRALAELLTHYDVITRRDYPQIASQIDYALRSGELARILPGVYAPRDLATDWRTVAKAVPLWDPAAVIIGETAAALTFWEELRPRTVEVVTARRLPRGSPIAICTPRVFTIGGRTCRSSATGTRSTRTSP